MDDAGISSRMLTSLYDSAAAPGIFLAKHIHMGYGIPGFAELEDVMDRWDMMDALAQLESCGKVEFVEDKKFALLYLPDYLIETSLENRRRARELRFMPYPEYLETPEWFSRAELVRKRDYRRCKMCGHEGETHVHHKTYVRRGVERLADLVTLCARCHAGMHRWDREDM